MALQYSTALRNAQLDQVESTITTTGSISIFTGSPPANCAAANSGSLLVTGNLPSDFMAAASSGSKAIANGPWSYTASGTGTAAHFRIYNSQATKDGTTCTMQGTVGVGGGFDMSIDNASITNGQTVNVTAFTLSAGNA